MYDQEDNQTHYRTDEFIFGEHILACPVGEPNAKGRRVYLPKGKWYDFWTNELVEGGKEVWVDADLDSMPIFVREGAIIPKYPVMQYVGEKVVEQLEMDVYFKDGIQQSDVFEDSGDGYDYQKGRFSLRNLSIKGRDGKLTIKQHKSGKYDHTYSTIKVNLKGLPFDVARVRIDNEDVTLEQISFKDNSFVTDHVNFHTIQVFE